MKKQICVTLFALLFVSAMPLSAMEPRDLKVQRSGERYIVSLMGADRFPDGSSNKKQLAGAVTSTIVGGGLGAFLGALGAIKTQPESKKVSFTKQLPLFAALGAFVGVAVGMRLGVELSERFLADAEDKTEEKQS